LETNIHQEDPLSSKIAFRSPEQMKSVASQRSEMMEEIVSDKPGFLIRWGNVFFLLLLTLLVIGTWFIKYPDVIYAKAKLTSINAQSKW